MRIGFDIPFKSAGRLGLNELQIGILESESQYRNFKTQLVDQKYASFNQLNNLIQKHELVSLQLKEGQAEFVLQEYQKIAEAPPKAIVKLRENTLRTTLLVKELEYEIFYRVFRFFRSLDSKAFEKLFDKRVSCFLLAIGFAYAIHRTPS